MPKLLVIEEFHTTIFVPRGLQESEYRAIRRALNSQRFQAELRRAVGQVIRRHRSLAKIRLTISR
jgi:hypothetical protein